MPWGCSSNQKRAIQKPRRFEFGNCHKMPPDMFSPCFSLDQLQQSGAFFLGPFCQNLTNISTNLASSLWHIATFPTDFFNRRRRLRLRQTTPASVVIIETVASVSNISFVDLVSRPLKQRKRCGKCTNS